MVHKDPFCIFCQPNWRLYININCITMVRISLDPILVLFWTHSAIWRLKMLCQKVCKFSCYSTIVLGPTKVLTLLFMEIQISLNFILALLGATGPFKLKCCFFRPTNGGKYFCCCYHSDPIWCPFIPTNSQTIFETLLDPILSHHDPHEPKQAKLQNAPTKYFIPYVPPYHEVLTTKILYFMEIILYPSVCGCYQPSPIYIVCLYVAVPSECKSGHATL